MGKIVEGAWDCAYCGHTQIGGSLRECPGCGHPRDKDVKFYVPKTKRYVAESEVKSKSEDWICPYCNALNSAAVEFCESCGAPKSESTESYFNRTKSESDVPDELPVLEHWVPAETEPGITHHGQPSFQPESLKAAPNKDGACFNPAVLLLLIPILAVIWILIPKNKTVSIAETNWTYSVEVEQYRAVQESSWSLPTGAYNTSQRQEIRSYDQVLDHYETRTREVSEKVFDGYDTYTTYRDMGNGMFEEEEHQTPRYRTEWHTETYEDPVYISVPVYDTRYYYTIDKWVYDRTETETGTDHNPHYPELTLAENECKGGTKESYTIVSTENEEYQIDQDTWAAVHAGGSYKLKISGAHAQLAEAGRKT